MNTHTQRRLAAIVSIDVVGYSHLMGRDETGTLAALASHRADLIDPGINQHGGRIVKTMGDGLLVEFPSLVNAARAALDIQNGMVAHDVDIDEGSVQAMGQRMRANIQLIDGSTGEHLWAERYDFTDDDLFDAQDRVVADAVVEIDAAIDLGDIARKRRAMVGSAEAYAIYQRAYGFVTEGNPASVLKSRREWLKLKALPDAEVLRLSFRAFRDWVFVDSWLDALTIAGLPED